MRLMAAAVRKAWVRPLSAAVSSDGAGRTMSCAMAAVESSSTKSQEVRRAMLIAGPQPIAEILDRGRHGLAALGATTRA
ncbi:hypothetical protein DPM13_15895 [Paracoccus mutanolyticus]|uniref:Uncharacterized protein n=1 Tax=Paracoccus mutanolyticus TaxID=1499308 RepID=A0ABN5MAW5_9RHOB|nr:hypothetical protein DPM13_15895 [Paracoccus mutanolyticus]